MKSVVITGASGGLGGAIARCFGRYGARVLVHYHRAEDAACRLAEEIRQQGSEAIICQADLRDRAQVREVATVAKKSYGGIDVWINNAGITTDRLVIALDEPEWDEVLAVNLKAAFYGIQETAPVMAARGSGHIINIASLVGLRGNAGQAAYAASKAGLIGLTKAAARELGRYHVQVNAVLPGVLPTRMTRNIPNEYLESLISENVLGRSSDLAEVADFIRHLASMRHVSGQVFNLDSRIL